MYMYIHTMEYYLATNKNEILPLVTTWMNFEGIMLSEISQRGKTNTIWSHLYVESKTRQKPELIENILLVARSGE